MGLLFVSACGLGGNRCPRGVTTNPPSPRRNEKKAYSIIAKNILYITHSLSEGDAGFRESSGCGIPRRCPDNNERRFRVKKEVGCGCCVNVLDFIHDYHFKKRKAPCSDISSSRPAPPRPAPPHSPSISPAQELASIYSRE